MAWKKTGQLSLADGLVIQHKSLEELDDLHRLIDWSLIEQLLKTVHNAKKGERAFHPVLMFKVLLLQKLYGLSDPKMEKQLARDLLFRRFVGLSLTDDTPDHSTIWRFHRLLGDKQLIDPLFDASVVEAKNKRPRRQPDKANTQDKAASYHVKKDSSGQLKTTFGFSLHANADEDGFIKKLRTTTGRVHDSVCFELLLTNEESAVYADSAYKSRAHDRLLKAKGIGNRIHERGYRNKPLTQAQKDRNTVGKLPKKDKKGKYQPEITRAKVSIRCFFLMEILQNDTV